MVLPFITVLLSRDHGATLSEIGTLFTIAAVSGMLVAPFMGALADKAGLRHILLTAVPTVVACLVFLAFASSKLQFFTGIFALLLISGATDPLLRSALGNCATEETERSKLHHLRYYGVNLAAAAGPMLGVGFVNTGNTLLFIVSAILFALLGLCVFRTVDQHAERVSSPKEHSSFIGLSVLSKDFAFISIFICNFFLVLIYTLTDEPLIFYLISLKVEEIAWLIAAFSFVNAITVLIVHGLLMQTLASLNEGTALIAAMSFMAISLIMIAVASPETWLIWVAAIIVATFAEIIAMPLFLTMIDRIAPPANRNTYFGIYSLSNGGGAFVPVLMPVLIAQTGGAPVFWGAAIVCAPIAWFGVLAFHYSVNPLLQGGRKDMSA